MVGGDRMLYEVCCSSSNTGLYVTFRSSSPLLLSAILSSVGKWSMWPTTDWKFCYACSILVTFKEILSSSNNFRGGILE
jgi:hypothetical protein